MKKTLLTCATLLAATLAFGAAFASGTESHELKKTYWPFDGVMGKVDEISAQRGFQVYKEVCSACHGLQRVALRNLTALGFSEAEVKALAATYTVQDGPNDSGEMFDRPGKPSDRFPSPYPNEQAARAAQNGAYPPDLSLMIKARHDGANYLYSLLTGYEEPIPAYRCAETDANGTCVKFTSAHEAQPAQAADSTIHHCVDIKTEEVNDKDGNAVEKQTCTELQPGMNYNPYFPGKQIAMPAPLSEGKVEYADATPATLEQEAKDVVNFLQWAAEPEMEQRKQMGLKVLIYLAIFTAFMYIAKKRIWKRIND